MRNSGSVRHGDRFDFAEDLLRELLDGDAGARGLADKVLLIHGIEGGKVLHVGEEAGRLDDLGEIHSGGLQDGADVFAALFRLLFDLRSDDLAGGRIQGDLAGSVQKSVCCVSLGIGADRCGSILGCDLFHT